MKSLMTGVVTFNHDVASVRWPLHQPLLLHQYVLLCILQGARTCPEINHQRIVPALLVWQVHCLFLHPWSLVRVFQSYHSLTRVYYYVINEEGQPTYMGTHTSVISYNKSISSWVWWEWTGFYANSLRLLFARYDKKDPSSEAVSLSSPASLLLGLQTLSSFMV